MSTDLFSLFVIVFFEKKNTDVCSCVNVTVRNRCQPRQLKNEQLNQVIWLNPLTI